MHVIFGTGAAGLATFDALRRRGATVRLVNRSGRAPVPDGVEVVGGDAGDARFAVEAARGARVVYQALNPPYHRWATGRWLHTALPSVVFGVVGPGLRWQDRAMRWRQAASIFGVQGMQSRLPVPRRASSWAFVIQL